MEKITRWMAKNRLAAKLLLLVPLGVAYGLLLLDLDAPIWAYFLLELLLAFIISVYVDACGQYLQKKPLQVLNETCDPYPFQQELKEQLTYNNTDAAKQVLLINYSMTLRETGEFQQSWEILDGIHIDQLAGTLPSVKATYYNNLADILTLLERFEEAEIWYGKALEIYQDMKENRFKRQLAPAIEAARADHYYRAGEYRRAMEVLDGIPRDALRAQVDAALMYARCCIALGETDSAREKLEFVIRNGNRLHCVHVARELLESL